ncbi:MAG: DUF192 domain-containing protein [Deltaproteobacteria bacterium]|nr:DUF192 domain-containing protein [Deltaproteobacteria bacterium]
MESEIYKLNCRGFLAAFFLAIWLLFSCGHHRQELQSMPLTDSIRVDGTLDFVQPDGSVAASIFIEIADTPETQMKGLMGRHALADTQGMLSLADTQGMLFVFERVTPRKFWMKDTPVPLDIIFAGSDGCVVHIAESTPPMSDQRVTSGEPIKYVVEVRAGFAKRFKIDADTCIRWRRLETAEKRKE